MTNPDPANLAETGDVEALLKALEGNTETIAGLSGELQNLTEMVNRVVERARTLGPSAAADPQNREILMRLEGAMAAVEMNRQEGVTYARALRRLDHTDPSPVEQFLAAVRGFDQNRADQTSREIQE